MEQIQELIDDMNDYHERFKWGSDFENKYSKTFIKILTDYGDNDKSKLDELLLACIRCGDNTALELIAGKMLDRRKLIDWKNRPDLIDNCLDAVRENALLSDNTRHYTSWVEKFLQLLKANQIMHRHAEKIFSITEASLSTFDQTSLPIHNAALPCVTQFEWTDHPHLVKKAINLLLKLVKHNPDINESDWQCSTAGMVICLAMRGASGVAHIKINGQTVGNSDQQGSSLHELVLDDVSELFNFCADQEWQYSEDPSKKNIAYVMCQSIIEDFLGSGSTSPHLVKPMIAKIKELYECGDEILQRDAGYIMSAMAAEPELTADYTQHFLERFLDGKMPSLITHLQKMYHHSPEHFTPLIPRFSQHLRSAGSHMGDKIMIIQLFNEIAKKQPELINREIADTIASQLDDENQKYLAIVFFDSLAAVKSDDVHFYADKFVAMMHAETVISNQAAGLLVKLATDEQKQRKYLAEIAKACRKTNNETTKLLLINNMRTIGVKNTALLAEYRKLFEEYREIASLKDICQSTIDVIDGRTLEGVSQNVEQQGQQVQQLDQRVTKTDENVNKLDKNVKKNTLNISNVKADVKKQDEKLEELKEVVDETVEKVEDLDHKTLSHAPAWSREVARMLNPTAEHDWRLLASRLGYSHDDIRNWATQPDPCLSMFDEWFATHKTREATYGVLKTLVEMDRTDASVIVEKALEEVAHIVEEDDDEPAVPPPVFLSYQWAHQPEVKLLRSHLGSAGYSCWMDVGQMGGGDKLFAKIDAGIRAAKVIVCCVTSKYAESPNCNREINLAVNLGKPIIPLLMEKMSWPPPGAMGPIFGEYIFVRFFQRPGEETKDNRYWPEAKFTELLMQLRYTIAPDTSLMNEDSAYKNWWEPPEEVIVIKPKKQTESSSNASAGKVSKPDQSASPELFISYQWDKQRQITALYRKLTSLGYTCWLDIMQMGGGDSLYDKIDRGVRGCRVVLSCVTSKYAISGNCRREVSLADAIKKPIIPLLLDSKMTWPPEGPMSMVFTQLLYINFCKPSEDIQNDWNCPQFNELIEKIKEQLDMASNGSIPPVPSVQPTLLQPDKSPPKTQSTTSVKPSAGTKSKATTSATSNSVQNVRKEQPAQPAKAPISKTKTTNKSPPAAAKKPVTTTSPAPKSSTTNEPTTSNTKISDCQDKPPVNQNTNKTENTAEKMTSAKLVQPVDKLKQSNDSSSWMRSLPDVKRAAAGGDIQRRNSLPTIPTTRACTIL